MFKQYTNKTDGAIRGFDVKSTRTKIICIFIVFVCLLFALLALFPALWVFISGAKDLKELTSSAKILPQVWHFDGFKTTWEKLNFTLYYKNTFVVVIGAIACSIFFNGLTAYGLVIMKPRGSKIIDGLVMWSMLIPATTSVVALFVNINRIGLNGSFVPLVLCYGANAFYVILFKEFFAGIPKEIIEAAELDGCRAFSMFMRIIMPLSKPIITVVAIFTMTAAWSDFLLPYLILNGTGKETVMVKLYAYSTSRTTAIDMVRAIFFSMIPPTVLFVIFQRKIMDGAVGGAIKG